MPTVCRITCVPGCGGSACAASPAQAIETSRQNTNQAPRNLPRLGMPFGLRLIFAIGPRRNFSCTAGSLKLEGSQNGIPYTPGAGLPLRIAAATTSSFESPRKSGPGQNFTATLITELATKTKTDESRSGSE